MDNNDYNFDDKPNLPLHTNDEPLFGLPLNYFDAFETKLKQKMELDTELEQFTVLSSIKKNNVFNVPQNYFIDTQNSLEANAELQAFSKLKAIKIPLSTQLDEDYVKQLNTSINNKIELVDELKAYKTLYTLDKVNAFVVSDSYFETVAQHVTDKIYAVKQTNNFVFENVLNFIFGKKMAFAFGLITIITLSVYVYQLQNKPTDIGDCKTLACLEKQEILNNHKAISIFDEDQLMDLVDVNTLNEQLTAKQKIEKKDKINVDSISDDDLLDEL